MVSRQPLLVGGRPTHGGRSRQHGRASTTATIVGVGLNVLVGLTGQISFGHVAFYAIGAYTVGILTTGTGLSFWLALPLGTLIACAAGALLAIPALRVRGPLPRSSSR